MHGQCFVHFAVAARTLALVEGWVSRLHVLDDDVAARTLALVEGQKSSFRFRRFRLQLARWHWLKDARSFALDFGDGLPLARQRYLLNATILLFESTIQVYYSGFSTPNDFMFEFFL